MSMSNQSMERMAKTRALLTETDRKYITGDEGDEKRYQSASRIRRRIQDELPKDVNILEKHHPDLLAELRNVVCDPTATFTARDEQKTVSYGPRSDFEDGYVLDVVTQEHGKVSLQFPEEAMYGLWTEVQHTPWPEPTEEQEEAGELRAKLVERAMGADADMLQDALDAIDERP